MTGNGALSKGALPAIAAQIDVQRGVHTVAIDRKAGNVGVVRGASDGSFVQGYSQVP